MIGRRAERAHSSPFSPLAAALHVLLFVSAFVSGAGAAFAHPLAPALLELHERGEGSFDVRFKTSLYRSVGVGASLRPRLPEHCEPVGAPRAFGDGAAWIETSSLACGPRGLVGEWVGIDGLGANGIDALLRVELADGRTLGRVLRAGAPSVRIPARPSRAGVLVSYARLGVAHIATGPDHLLFVFGLLLLVATARQLLWTLTAFTLGHSVTLTLAALGAVAFPVGPVELLIALSVLVLAVELARSPRLAGPGVQRRRVPGTRFTAAMAAGFGLLHGLGFAGALAEAGLPAGEIPMALVAFNLGIEAGQVAFVGLALGAYRLGSLRGRAEPARARLVAVYAMGTLAASWCIERGAELLR